jgi:nucleoside 2-deoxyribosyltransferase
VKRPPLIYVSGPLTTGDTIANIRHAIHAGAVLIERGYAVIVPHEKALGMELLYPQSYDEWLAYDFRCILTCDAVLRIPGASKGGDAEVAFARERGIPVYYSFDTLVAGMPAPAPGTVEVYGRAA